jgi:hypothetical protein
MAVVPEWAIESGARSSFETLRYAVAIVRVSGLFGAPLSEALDVGVYLNPVDATCYRCLFRALVAAPEHLRFNLEPSIVEATAVHTAAARVGQLMRAANGLVLQTLCLGNNSHRVDEATGSVVLGNDREPYFYHVHGFWRGDPARQYLGADVPPLGGPPIGRAFALQLKHEPWSNHEVLAAAATAMCTTLAAAASIPPPGGTAIDEAARASCIIKWLKRTESS